jgi:fused signal recognition particle receptor
MRKTREALQAEVQATLFENLDEETWERLEEALIYADVGARTTAEVVERLETEAEAGDITAVRRSRPGSPSCSPSWPDRHGDHRPAAQADRAAHGRRQRTGKTTTTGKLAWHLRRELGQTVVHGAADTFRAAAVEQLERWAERADCGFVRGRDGADPGAVASTRDQAGASRAPTS